MTGGKFADMNRMHWRRILEIYFNALFKLHAKASLCGEHSANRALRFGSHYTRNGNLGRLDPLISEPRAFLLLNLRAKACMIGLPDESSVPKFCPGELSSNGHGRSDHVFLSLGQLLSH